jgi:hypothetical protein
VSLALLMSGIFFVNLPFGYWREGVRKFSPAWFVAVHAAVPIVVAMRLSLDIDWNLVILPALVAAYFAGQATGAWFRRSRAKAGVDR